MTSSKTVSTMSDDNCGRSASEEVFCRSDRSYDRFVEQGYTMCQIEVSESESHEFGVDRTVSVSIEIA